MSQEMIVALPRTLLWEKAVLLGDVGIQCRQQGETNLVKASSITKMVLQWSPKLEQWNGMERRAPIPRSTRYASQGSDLCCIQFIVVTL